MSTLSGIVSKGEKGKSKFQSLDINSLYRVSRGESLEPHQQKNTLPRKHGMQSLGKVPSARRPPANLPSLKSETSSSDPAVSLVPSGGSGWATTKDSTSSTTTTTTTVATSSLDNTTTVSSTAQCAAGTTVSTSLHSLLPTQQNASQAPFLDQANNKSSWSAIMSRSGDVVGYAGLVGGAKGGRGALGLSFLAHQSPQFQHEFPSLSGQPSASVSTQSQTQQSSTTSNAISVAVHQSLLQQQPYSHNHSGGTPGNQQQSNRELNAQYGPGPSLRPQTEGSWIQGGSRTAGGAVPVTSAGPGNGNTPAGQGLPLNIPVSGGHTQEVPGGGRQNLGQSPNMGAGPAGQHNAVNNQGSAPSSGSLGPNLHHYRGLIPPFMYRSSNFPGGFSSQFASNSGANSPRPRFSHPLDRFPPPPQRDRMAEEEILTRPIIKEEDLTRMDDISRDAGWAAHDDIDYNQKLAFSDDEGESESKHDEKKDNKEKKGDDNIAEEKEKSRDNRDSKELRDPPHRPWTQPMNRDYRGSNGASGGYANQSQLHSVHSLRGVEDDETWNERRRIKVEVASVVERARLRKEEEEKRFQESTKQAAAKKLQDLEQKLKEKQAKHKDEERAQSGEAKSLISIPPVSLPIPEWEREKENRERESRERSRTSSEGKDEKIISTLVVRDSRDNLREGRDQGLTDFRQSDRQNFLRQDPVRSERERERDRDRDQRDSRDREQPAFSRHFQNNLPPRFQKQQAERSSANFNRISPNAERPASQSVPFSQQYDPGRWLHNYNSLIDSAMKQSMPSQRRNRTDSDASAPLDDERPPSRDHRGGGAPSSREDRYRHSSHRSYDSRKPGGYYDEYSRNFRDYEYDDRHPRDSWERERHFDDKERDPKENLDSRDNRDGRDSRDNRDGRDVKDSRPTSRDARDVRDVRDKEKKDYDNYSKDSFDEREQRERSENPEWREERNVGQDRQLDSRRDAPKEERNERPQRPDSRDSRTSRESKTSLRDDDLHKLRDCSSWVNEVSDYEEKKRDMYHEETRERERDRRQPPGPVTKEKLEADELKNEKRSLTQLKRGSSDLQEKKEQPKEISAEAKKDTDVWNRKTERTPESRQIDRGDNSPKAWADAISPTFEKEEEKMAEAAKDGKESDEIKQSSLDKPALDKREEAIAEDAKDQAKDEKREKSTRNRTSSSGSSSRIRETRGGRQWGGTFSVYTRGWRGPESRGRRGGPRPTGKAGMSAKSGSYGHTDSENSADEISGSTESGKEDKRSARSPKPSQKIEKDERNREVSRRDDKRGAEYSQTRSEKRTYDGKPSHEGFAPSGEPSRRGRGGFRIRSTATGSRMEGYGPPSSKSPFSERNTDEKHQQQTAGRQNPPTPTSEKEAGLLQSTSVESTDDKIIAKQQALTAGITGRRKSPSQQAQQSGNKQEANHANQVANVPSQKVQMRKDESRSKRTRSGSRRGRDSREARSRGNSGTVAKQSQSDVGNEDWETTSENSEEHIDDHKDSRNSRNKHFGGRAIQSVGGQNAIGMNLHSRRNEQLANTREQREKNPKSSNPASRAPGAEKRSLQNAGFSAQKNHADGIPPLMQNAQIQNGGRSRSQSSTNSGAVANKSSNKDSMVNRIDEIKLSDPNLVNQALNDLNKKSQTKDKKLTDSEIETNSCTEDATSGTAEDKVDADGFQEVRSKKNVKESRHNQKEEVKPVKRDKEKERERERDRSKSKSNGSQQVLQQVQNIPPLLGQNIPQPANIPSKQYDSLRNSRNPRLAPRFQRLVKQQQQQLCPTDASDMSKLNSSANNYAKDSSNSPAPPPAVNAWDKPFTSQLRSNSPSAIPTDIQLMSGLTAQNDHSHEGNEANSGHSSQRNSPSGEKTGKNLKEPLTEKNVSDVSSPPVQTLIFENTNYSKTTKTTGPTDLAVKSKFSNHIKTQQRAEKRAEMEEEGNQVQQHQQPALAVAFSKPNDLIKDKSQEPIQMSLSFNKNEDNADMKLDFNFESELSQLDDKSKSLGMARSMHMAGGQSTISPSTAELNLKIASVKKVWENAPPMPTVVEHEDGTSVVSSATSFPQAFESGDVDDSYSPHQQYNQSNMKSEITTSTNVCKLVPPQVKPQQQSSGSSGTQPGSTVPGPSPIGAGQSPIGHPPVSLQGPLSPPPFNSTGQPSHINYQEFPQYPGSQAAQYGGMSAIPSPPAVLFNTGSGQLPAQAGGLYGAFQLDQSRSPFTQYAPYAPSLQSSFSQQNVYLQQPPPPPPHAPNAPTPEMYQNNLSQYRITAAAAPPFGQNQQLSNNPNTVLISSSSNSLMSASVKPSSQPIGAIGTKAPHFQTQSAPQPNQLAYIPYDPNQVLGVSGSYMSNSQLVQRPGPNVQASNSYYSATSADVFPGSQTGFYQSGGATQQTGTHYGLQGFGQHSQSLATGSATPVGLQNYGPSFLSSSGLQIAAAAQQFRNPTGGLPGPGNAPTFLSKHQPQEQPRQLKSPSGNQQDVLASVFSSTPQIPSPKSRNCKQQSSSQQPQPSPTQHHKYQQYQGVSQSALVSSYNNYVLQQNVRGMGMPPRAGIQPSQQRYPTPIQRPAGPFAQGPNPNNPTQQQPVCMQQQQAQINRHRPNLHQQQQQQRNMKMQQQYYPPQGNVKMDSNDKSDSHNDKMNDGPSGTQPGSNKPNVNQQDSDNNKEEVNQQNE
ncbi:PREDICTED: protein PRRC2C isoform X3 [Wasmannia auropunctata]|uniref:protein PRRC2C isoform X3 n=1 Tax=Wasmannia auropunctata TaxID=64793 RepID=UPI0005EF8006|nr:PREDICTED: protein PRRC2C isoform X3 [Wasmannia auropunctata]